MGLAVADWVGLVVLLWLAVSVEAGVPEYVSVRVWVTVVRVAESEWEGVYEELAAALTEPEQVEEAEADRLNVVVGKYV